MLKGSKNSKSMKKNFTVSFVSVNNNHDKSSIYEVLNHEDNNYTEQFSAETNP